MFIHLNEFALEFVKTIMSHQSVSEQIINKANICKKHILLITLYLSMDHICYAIFSSIQQILTG